MGTQPNQLAEGSDEKPGPAPAPAPRVSARGFGARGVIRTIRAALAIVLGVVLPIVLLTLAYQAIARLDDQVVVGADLSAMTTSLPAAMQRFESANDYAFSLVTYLEASNQRIVANKNRMKIAVMHIGFAVSCVGLLLLVLGIDAGGIEVSGSAKDTASLNLKVTSSGVAVFVLGAMMAAAGGLLPNSYTTLGVPGFIDKGQTVSSELTQKKLKQLADAIAACEDGPASVEDFRNCTRHVRATSLKGKD